VRKILPLTVLFVALVLPAAAGELVFYGDFEQPLDVGWTDTVQLEAGTYFFDRTDTLGQPSPGFVAVVHKELARYASLRQTVDVPDLNLDLSFDCRLKIGGGSSTCWPVASFWVRYADSSGLELGNTRIYLHNQYSTWQKSDTVDLVNVADTTGAWHHYAINLKEHVGSRLPGIDPDQVKKITLDLFAYDNGT
jgi:hypothetical protein